VPRTRRAAAAAAVVCGIAVAGAALLIAELTGDDPAGTAMPRRAPATVERRRLAVLHAPSRKVIFAPGEAVPYVTAGEYESVTLAERPGRTYPVDAIWIDAQNAYENIAGVVMVERDTPVTRWKQLARVAYGTDGGLGGITTVEWAAQEKSLDGRVQRRWEEELIRRGRQSFAIDADDIRGIDTIAFANGFGDGGFPSIAGYDASGHRSAIVLWSIVAPWRLAFPQGEPPRQVTAREDALAACLAGRRKVDGARCRVAR
jgi:hypothetical protein